MKYRKPILSAATLLLVGTACGVPLGPLPEPSEHRTSGAMCDDAREPGSSPENSDYASCTGDEDCTDGDNGRCSNVGRGGYACTYDNCFTDDDCGSDAVCDCSGGAGGSNTCLPGNCQTDADCGDTGYCSPSLGTCGNYSGTVGYFCHTRRDECVDDADCDGEGTFGDPYCMYDQSVGHWRCNDSHCVG